MISLDELRDVLGEGAIAAPEELSDRGHDWSATALLQARRGQVVRPAAVVRPGSTLEVSEVLRWADATKTPVVPFGGGSDVCRAIEAEGFLVVDLGRMNSVLGVDEKSMLLVAQAGVSGPAAHRSAEDRELLLGHVPQSVSISTVGGWVATRACGQLSAGYGGIEDMVAGLEAVLPGGKVVRSRTSPRRSTGPDVAQLMFGSEGTLGIVTEVTLRLRPQTAMRAQRAVRFDHMSDGVAACRRLIQSSLHPTLVRLYDREDAALLLRDLPDEEITPTLLLLFDGDDAEARAQLAVELTEARPASPDIVEHWLAHRFDAVEEYRKLMSGEGLLGPHAIVDTMEVSGTWSQLRDLYHQMKESLSAIADLCACHVSHVYSDGACLYFTLASVADDDDDAARRHERWWETGMETCLKEGGSISHHHGIGRLKAKWLPQELGGWYDVLRAIKRTVDPNNIMNPGALGL